MNPTNTYMTFVDFALCFALIVVLVVFFGLA